jgi:hypothetical protein
MREVEIARADWAAYFTALSASGAGARASVQVLSGAALEPPVPAEGWLLDGCSYDDRSELLELTLTGGGGEPASLRCFVSAPREILVRDSQLERSFLVRDAAGARTLVRLRRRAEPSHLTIGLSSWRAESPAVGSRIRVRAGVRTNHTGLGGGDL